MARIDTARKEILNTIPDIVIVVNSSGKVIYTNNTFSTITGISDYDARSSLIVSRLFPQMKVDFFISTM
jgi:PAS domain S-box-containing protein